MRRDALPAGGGNPTVDGCEILHQLIDRWFNPVFIGFNHPRWCRGEHLI